MFKIIDLFFKTFFTFLRKISITILLLNFKRLFDVFNECFPEELTYIVFLLFKLDKVQKMLLAVAFILILLNRFIFLFNNFNFKNDLLKIFDLYLNIFLILLFFFLNPFLFLIYFFSFEFC